MQNSYWGFSHNWRCSHQNQVMSLSNCLIRPQQIRCQYVWCSSSDQIITKNMRKIMNKSANSGCNIILAAHNLFVHQLCVIVIRFLLDGFPDMMVGGATNGFPEQSFSVPFWQFIVENCKAISIKESKETTDSGTYQIILLDDDYYNSTKHLHKLFTAFKKNLDHEVTKGAKQKWKHNLYIKLLFSIDEFEIRS